MLTPNELKHFFTRHSIPLSGKKPLLPVEIDQIIKSAADIGSSFGGFIVYSVIDINQTGIETGFNDWDILYESYCFFVRGHIAATSKNYFLNN